MGQSYQLNYSALLFGGGLMRLARCDERKHTGWMGVARVCGAGGLEVSDGEERRMVRWERGA